MSQKYSAIDIGSNAIRMIVGELVQTHTGQQLRIVKKWRAPVRLGEDAFKSGHISQSTFEKAHEAFSKFKQINKKHKILNCRAVATSALREAKNNKEFVEKILKETDIQIEIIDGIEEGNLIHLAVQKEIDLQKKKALLIDIGGGSVELTLSDNGFIQSTKSFPMGTVRTLENLQKRNLKEDQMNILIGEYIDQITHFLNESPLDGFLNFAVGTGGNLECLGELKVQLLKKTPNTYLTIKELGEIIQHLRKISIKDRIQKLDLRPDRADVIIPASMLVQTVMNQAGCEKILIPRVGLRDGILWSCLPTSHKAK